MATASPALDQGRLYEYVIPFEIGLEVIPVLAEFGSSALSVSTITRTSYVCNQALFRNKNLALSTRPTLTPELATTVEVKGSFIELESGKYHESRMPNKRKYSSIKYSFTTLAK